MEYVTPKGQHKTIEFYHGGFKRKPPIYEASVDSIPPPVTYYNFRQSELIVRMLRGRCELCGEHANIVRIHQVAALKDLKADKNAGVENYDTIFIGFPIWWYVAPTIINTFLESYDFSNKKVIVFATSGSSGFGKTVEGLKVSVPDSCEIIEGKLLNGRHTIKSVRAWTETLNV